MRSLRDRYEVIYDWPSPTAMIPRAEPTIHAQKSSMLHVCWPSANDYQSSVQSSNNVPWWAGPGELFTRNSESSSASALGSIVSMTSYWNAYKLHIPIQSPIAMAMETMSSDWKPPSMPPNQDEAHTMIGDFTEITVSNSNNDLHLVRVTSARLNGQMPDIPQVEIWRTVSLGCFLFLFSSLYIFTSLLLYFFGSQPSTNGVGTGFYHLWR